METMHLAKAAFQQIVTKFHLCAVVGRSDHLVLLRRYVSRQAWGKGRALLEVLGLTTAQIAQCYSMHPLNEEESVQDGLQVWIKGGRNTNWGDLLRAMGTAGIAIQQCDGLKVELCSNTGESVHELLLLLTCVCV